MRAHIGEGAAPNARREGRPVDEARLQDGAVRGALVEQVRQGEPGGAPDQGGREVDLLAQAGAMHRDRERQPAARDDIRRERDTKNDGSLSSDDVVVDKPGDRTRTRPRHPSGHDEPCSRFVLQVCTK